MATHSSVLAWRVPMDRGAWWATVHEVADIINQINLDFNVQSVFQYLQEIVKLFSQSQENNIKFIKKKLEPDPFNSKVIF